MSLANNSGWWTELDHESPFASPLPALNDSYVVNAGLDELELLSEDELEPPYVEEEDEEASASSLAARAVAIARQELAHWNPGPKAQRTETDPAMRGTLRGYWLAVTSARDAEKRIDDRSPWSAAFISWVMKQAGAGSAFKYSPAHRVYVSAAKAARVATNRASFWAYRISEVRPEVGDLVCRDRRPGKSKPCAGTTYDNVDDGSARATHSDIVVAVRSREIDVVGGNVSNSVALKTVALDADGHVAQPSGCKYFAIMKPPSGAPTVSQAPANDPAATTSAAGAMSSPLQQIASAARAGALTIEAGLAIAAGNRDENALTNLVFYARHPEIPRGHRIGPHEKALAQDWVRLRDEVIRPLLRQLTANG